jgi:Uma2 family endonuclease
MSSAAHGGPLPVTEEEYLSLGETAERVELFDGRIEVSPSATPLHQAVSLWLATSMHTPARQLGLRLYQDINMRLRPGRIAIPDLAIVKGVNPRDLVVDASAARLVCEIVSPSNAANDRVLKMRYYAEAGIPWYLLVDPRHDLVLQLYRWLDGQYTLEGEGRAGSPLQLTDPVEATLDPADLEL